MDTSSLPPLPSVRKCPFDPPQEYKQFRAEQPIIKVKTPRGDSAWLVTKHDDICAALVDKRLSSDPRTPGFPSYMTGDLPPPPGFFLQADPPDHTRLRRSVTRKFLAAHVETLRPMMQRTFDEVFASMMKLTPPVDFIKVLAVPVAARIICELLGVPVEEHPFIQSRTDTVLDRSKTPEEAEKAAIELMSYFDRVVTAKEQAPTDDLLGHLVQDALGQGQPNHQELVGLAALLLLSAYDTMAQVIGLGTVTLLEHPDQLRDLIKDPSLAENMVEEMVRYLTVNHAGLPRAATADIEIGGQLIRAGEGVIVMLNSGNRDELAFQNPDAFDLRRDCKHHVGFGHGLHKCIGADFARAELQIVFVSLFQRLPTLRLAASVDELPFRHEMVLYGLKKLPVAW